MTGEQSRTQGRRSRLLGRGRERSSHCHRKELVWGGPEVG